MPRSSAFAASCWDDIRLVVFDLDGTLYRQAPVRARMAMALLLHAGTGGAREVKALRTFRELREKAHDVGEDMDFEHWALGEAARATGLPVSRVEALVRDWIETRPLPLLERARYAGIAELFAALRASGRRIAIWSDHPVAGKLAALGLAADDMLSATDPELRRLKPDPRGLQLLMRNAGAAPESTLMIGDRADRDGAAAAAAETHALLRSSRPLEGFATFRRYDEAVFAPVLLPGRAG